jgi:hypothetical protein
MNLKAVFVAAVTAIALVSCGSSTGGTGNTALKKNSVKSTNKVFEAFSKLNLFAPQSAALRPQASENITVDCDVGEITYTIESTDNGDGGSVTFKMFSTGCTEGGEVISKVDLTMTFDVASSGNTTTFDIKFDGSIELPGEKLVFGNLSFKMVTTANGQNVTFSIVVNGSISYNGENVIFANETFSASDIGE